MASVVCAYQIKSVHEVAEHGSENTKLACCSLYSGEACWVTCDSLWNCRADLLNSHRVKIQQLPFGLDKEHAQTVVEIAHPYPAHVEAMFKTVCRIEALLRNAHQVVTHQETPEQSSNTLPSVTSFDTPVTLCPDANAASDLDEASDFDALLRDVMCDDFGGLD